MAELLYWIALDCTGVPNKVFDECIYHITNIKAADVMATSHKVPKGRQMGENSPLG